jgi:hypothetical protein
MKKRLLLLASAVLFNVAAYAQGIYADPDAIGLTGETSLEAGLSIGENDAISLSIATPDTYKPGGTQVSPFTTFVINGEEFAASKGITGKNNPKDAEDASPEKSLKQPATGTAFQVDAKQDGYVVAWAKMTANKAYTVFEDGVAIGYHAVMYNSDGLLDATLQGEGDNNQVTSKIGNIATLAGISSSANGMGVIVFPVSAGKSYIVNAAGSKVSLGGVYFSADEEISVKIKGSEDEVTLLASIYDYTVSPKANAKGVVANISPIVLTFTQVEKVEDNPNAAWEQYPSVEYNSPRAGWSDVPAEPTVEGNTVSLTIEENDQIDGEYKVTIPAGTYLLDGKENRAIEVTLTQGSPLAYTTTPINNGYATTLSPIQVTFPNAEKVEDNPNAAWEQYPSVEYNSPRAGWGEIGFEPIVEGNTISLTIEENDQIDGEYKVTIPAGTYLVDGAESPEVVITFSYANPLTYTTTPINNGYATTLSPIQVTFPNAEKVEDNPNADYYTQYAQVAYNSSRAGWGDIEAEPTVEGNTISLTIGENDQNDGEYKVTIPAGTYLVDGVESPEIIITFTYTNPLAYTTTPINNGYTKDISAPIVVTFTNAEEVVDNPDADYWTQYAQVEYNSPRAGWGEIPAEPTVEGNTVSFKLDEQDQLSGEFRLTIPAGTYLVDGLENQEIVLTFTVVSAQDYQVTPEANANGIVNTISPIVVTFPYADTVEDNPAADYYTQYAYVAYNSPRAGLGELPAEVTLDGTSVSFALETSDQIAGEFHVLIPAGTYLIDGEENKDIDVVLNYGALLDYTTTPADADTLNELGTLAVAFPYAVAVEDNPDADYFTQYAQVEYNSPRAGWGEIPAEATIEGSTINFELEDQDKISGEFRVTIPAGTYLVDGEESPEVVFTFNYVNLNDYTVEVSNDSVIVTFTNVEKVEWSEDLTALPTLTYDISDQLTDWGAAIKTTVKGNQVIFKIADADFKAVEYTLTIPAGTFELNGVANEEIVETIDLTEPVDVLAYTVTPTPNDTTATISPIVVTFTNATEVVDNPDADYWTQYAYVEYNSPRGGWGEIGFEPIVEGNTVSFKIDDQDLIAGEFRLTIPAGTYLVDGVENEEIVVTIIYEPAATAIEGIQNDARKAGIIYNLRGVRVDAKAVTPGVYVIDGKKVMLR